MDVCVNCGAELTGPFCANCGQKRFVESDRKLGHLLHHFVASATDLDGRVWRTLRALLFQPGLLSREYFEGRRMRWLSPLSLIFAVSLLYFAAPLHGGDFTLQFNQQVNGHIRELALGPDDKRLTPEQAQASGQFHSRFTTAWLQRRVSERDAALRSASAGATGYSYRDYRLAYDAKADDVSKALILLHLPFAACVLMVLFYRQRRYFAEHIVFLTHYVAFYIIVQVIDDALYRLVIAEKWPVPDDVFNWATRAVLIVYATLAIRRAYGVGFVAASAAAAVMLATLIFVNLYIFRAIQFAVTFALT